MFDGLEHQIHKINTIHKKNKNKQKPFNTDNSSAPLRIKAVEVCSAINHRLWTKRKMSLCLYKLTSPQQSRGLQNPLSCPLYFTLENVYYWVNFCCFFCHAYFSTFCVKKNIVDCLYICGQKNRSATFLSQFGSENTFMTKFINNFNLIGEKKHSAWEFLFLSISDLIN